jgi:hypothetical protein
MKLLPLHTFELASPLSWRHAFEAMAKHVEPPNLFRITVIIGLWTIYGDKGPAAFEGESTADGFSVPRIAGARNVLMPRTEIALANGRNNTKVTVRMRLALMTYALFLLPLIPLTAAGPALERMLGGAIVLVGAYAIILAFFWHEAAHQHRVLRDIFQARDASPEAA